MPPEIAQVLVGAAGSKSGTLFAEKLSNSTYSSWILSVIPSWLGGSNMSSLIMIGPTKG